MLDRLPLFDPPNADHVNQQLMAYTRLFETEITQFMIQKSSMHLQYLTTLEATTVKWEEYVDWFVTEILTHEETFVVLHDEIKRKDTALYNQIHMMKATDENVVKVFKDYFLRPSPFPLRPFPYEEEDDTEEPVDEEGITVIDRISMCYHPDLTQLKNFYPSLGMISDPVIHPMHSTVKNFRPYARAILRALPNQKSEQDEIPGYPSLIYHFASDCYRDSTNLPSLIYLLPDYEIKMAEREAVIRARHRSDYEDEEEIEEMTQFRDPEEFKGFRDPNYRLEDAEIPAMRNYQLELAENAEKGENTVIVAPTGSGKTVVAGYIIREHMERRREMEKGTRVVLVAPTIPLVDQHGSQLHRQLRDIVYMDYMHGNVDESQSKRIKSLLSNNLVVCTPQLLINCLQSVRREDRLFISDFSLLILDECHHTDERHPYAQLMSIVRKAKGDTPQVVGMTASLGIGKKGLQNVDLGVSHVKKLLARMGATSLSTVVKNLSELNRHVNRPSDCIEEASRPPLKDCPFTQTIIAYMNKIRDFLTNSLEPFTEYSIHAEFILPKSLFKTLSEIRCDSSARFVGIMNDIKSKLNDMRNGPQKKVLVDAINMILAYAKTLDLNDVLPAQYALKHMRLEMDEDSKTKKNEYLDEFYSTQYKKLMGMVEKEKDKEMVKKVTEHILSMEASSRCIVFVETREICQYLSQHINTILPKKRKCGYIMSSKSNGSRLITQSPTDQANTLRDFRDGSIQVMVATTVANEGIDIPQCNFILKYNMTGNVITKVQQEGRARAGGRSILIVLSDSVLERERENLAAAVRMKSILEGMRLEGPDKLKKDINDKMKELEKEDAQEEADEKQREQDLAANRFDLLCVKCRECLCASYTIKVDPFSNTYYSTDPSIWNRIDILIGKKIKTQNIIEVGILVGNIACASCSKKGYESIIGKLYRISSCYLPALRMNALRFKDCETGRVDEEWKMGWEKVHEAKFYISKIREEQMRATLNALKHKDNILFHRLEVRCKQIEQRSMMNRPRVRIADEQREWED
ncbi:hypothetical protein PFISCL1PPCAC_10346 [Pristionchus fissidentatus]|uniref:RNA helicase n=1 Tax=Pristionchus fissidentatus TaxID=1538716 RepID=A0AAV5VKX6_9BILA|nr:hypothetical protein PFISCL1PPCAC_10346 [Pristionchus fissidentatus]